MLRELRERRVLVVVSEGSSKKRRRVLGLEKGAMSSLMEVSTSSKEVKGMMVALGWTMAVGEEARNRASRMHRVG